MSLKKGITVLICTHNGANNLSETLKHLSLQEFNKNIPCEIILVVNASTDNSKEVAQTVWKKFNGNIPLIIASEPKKGKENAVDKGFEMANYQYVIICDDDNWLDKNYIQ